MDDALIMTLARSADAAAGRRFNGHIDKADYEVLLPGTASWRP